MVCRLCKKQIECERCLGVGVLYLHDPEFGKIDVECIECHNLHPKCYAILNQILENYQDIAKSTHS